MPALAVRKMDYCTPPSPFSDALKQEFHSPLRAGNANKRQNAPHYYTPETDGLKKPVESWEVCILQPSIPRREVGKVRFAKAFMRKRRGRRDRRLLIPARTDTTYFSRLH